MAVTNLTNTKWQFNENFSYDATLDGEMYSLNFTSNHNNYEGLLFYLPAFRYIVNKSLDYESDVNNYVDACDIWDTGWIDQAYRTIEITGGEDVENPDLISFLQAHATQIVEPDVPSITDLTNMKLNFFDVVNLENGIWKINFKSNNQNFTSFTVEEPYVETGYLTFSSEEPFSLTIAQDTQYKGTLEYSTDAATWNTVNKGNAINSVNNTLYLRGSGNDDPAQTLNVKVILKHY